MKRDNYASIEDIRRVFPGADKVGKLTVFNIGGNKVRLIAAIHYNRKKIYIRAVLTHKEYNEGIWREWLCKQLTCSLGKMSLTRCSFLKTKGNTTVLWRCSTT